MAEEFLTIEYVRANSASFAHAVALADGAWCRPSGWGSALMLSKGTWHPAEAFEIGFDAHGAQWVRLAADAAKILDEWRARIAERGTWTHIPFSWIRATDINNGKFGFGPPGSYKAKSSSSKGVWVREAK